MSHARVNKQTEYLLYVLPDNKDQTLSDVEDEVAHQIHGFNAVLLFPDPKNVSSGSSGERKYNARFILNGHWLNEDGKRKEVSIGHRNFCNATFLSSSKNPNIKLISPETSNYQNILNMVLGYGGIQLSEIEKLPNVIHMNVIAPQHDSKSLVAAKTASRRFYGLYKPEDRKRTIKKLLEHAVRATAEDIKEIRRILDAPLKFEPQNLNYLRELLRETGTVKDSKGRVHKDRTLYQIFLGARDYDVTSENKVKVVDGSAEMLEKNYFSQLPDGEKLREEQYYGQFPKGFEENEKERVANESRELNKVMKVINTISDADCQQTLALDSFHGYDLRPASWATNDNKVLASAIYFQKTVEGLSCRFRDLNGHIKTKVIPLNQLPPLPNSIDALNKAEIKPLYLPTILKQLAEPGEFYTSEQIQKLKELSYTTVTAASQNDFENAWNQLQEYIKTIAGPWVNFNVLKALYEFRNYLEPKGFYTTGYHSNPELLKETSKLYDKNFESFGIDWYSSKNVLCAQKIIGLAQRDLTACELQLWAQGPFSVLINGNTSKRSFSFTYGGGAIAPFDSDLVFRLGYNYLVGGGDGWGGGLGAGRGVGGLEFLCRAKTSAQERLCRSLASNRIGAR